jgi:hypothetical protein
MVIGRDGKDCAAALPENPDIAAIAVIAKTSLRIGLVRSVNGGLRSSPAPSLADPKPLAAAARSLYMEVIPTKEQRMASRQIKMPVKDDSDKDVDEAPSQRKRPETGRYLLQVDRQTKGSYQTAEAAQSAALVIKKGYPIVQVSVYDSVEYTHTLVEAPGAAS